MPTPEIKRSDIVSAARSFLGLPWVHQGRHPEAGIDCIGLLILTAKKVGIDLIDCTNYSSRPDGRILMESLRVNPALVEKPTSEIAPVDAVVFWMANPSLPQHLGIITSNDLFIGDEYVRDGLGLIHTVQKYSRVQEEAIGHKWNKRLHAAFSFAGVE